MNAVIAIAGPLVALLYMVIWAVALVDVLRRPAWEFPEMRGGTDPKLVWTLVVLLGGGIGAVVYYLLVMQPRSSDRG